MHLCSVFGEAGNTALPFARDGVTVPRIDIGKRDLAFQGRLARTDRELGDRPKSGVPFLDQLLAGRDADLEHVCRLTSWREIP